MRYSFGALIGGVLVLVVGLVLSTVVLSQAAAARRLGAALTSGRSQVRKP